MGGRGGGKKSYHAGTLINPLFVKYCYSGTKHCAHLRCIYPKIKTLYEL